jgi:hypothetical protein
MGGVLGGLLAGAPEVSGQLRSERRGISANNLTSEQVQVLAPGVSWVYNWDPSPGNVAVGDEMEFLPMVWGRIQGQLDGVKAYLDGGARPSVIFFLNEPNFITPLGSFVSPLDSADWLETVRTTLADYADIPIIGPHMALGGAPEDSITAYDPILERTVTYTTALGWLDAYDHYVGEAPADALSFHSYKYGEMAYWVDTMYARSGKPVWVTEFAWWDAPDVDSLLGYIVETLDYLERSPKVERYAWFKADLGSRNKLSLLESTGATLTRAGQLYVNYPAFDPEHHYPVPGRVQAESYVGKENLAIRLAANEAGMGALFGSSRQSGWADYQLEVAESGRYRLRVRISSESFPALPEASGEGTTLADPPSGKERDLFFEVPLQAGPQTFRILVQGLNGQIDWLEFEALP